MLFVFDSMSILVGDFGFLKSFHAIYNNDTNLIPTLSWKNGKKTLTHFMPMVTCLPPKNIGFLIFLGGLERDQWYQIG